MICRRLRRDRTHDKNTVTSALAGGGLGTSGPYANTACHPVGVVPIGREAFTKIPPPWNANPPPVASIGLGQKAEATKPLRFCSLVGTSVVTLTTCSPRIPDGPSRFQERGCSDGLHALGIRLRRDSWVSVMYAEGLNSTKSSVTLQRTDRHGIVVRQVALKRK
jgi:hypothetical protein